MFSKNPKGLAGAPMSTKIALSLFMILAGIGYLFGFFNILLTYQDVDQEKGLSVADVRISYYGNRETTALEASIDGSMRQFFNDADYQTTKDWIAAGASEREWNSTILPLFNVSCNTCHSAEAAVANVVTATYEDVQEYLVQDTGKSIKRLVDLSHTHLPATLVIVFCLALVFSYTSYGETLKLIVMAIAFGSIALDIGSWWIAKFAAWGAPIVIIGGAGLGTSFAVLVLLSLYDIWLKKAPASAE